jgi:hypothetical protein
MLKRPPIRSLDHEVKLMRRLSIKASVLAFLLASAPAFAEPATPEGAKALGQSFAAYFGQSSLEQGIIAVAPQGDDYKVTIDLQRVIDMVGLPAGSVTLAPLSFLTAPQPGGTWKVGADGFPNLGFRMSTPDGDYSGSLALNNYKLAGVYDPKLATFLTMSNTVDTIDVKWAAKDAEVALQESGYAVDFQSSDAGGGAVSGKMRHTLKSLLETVTASGKGGAGGMRIVYKVGPMTSDGTIEVMKSRAMLDLWAFLVSEGLEHVLEHQDELKDRLTAMLPLWEQSQVTLALDGVSAELPFGEIKIGSFGERLAMTGLVPHGAFELGLKLDGLTIPAALLPAWAAPLLPSLVDTNLKFTLDGLDEMAKLAIAEVDFSDDPPLSDEAQEKLADLYRKGNPKLVIAPSRVASPNYVVSLSGEFSAVGPKPTGKVTIEAEGFDKSFAILQAAAQGNPQLQQALMGLGVAKGLAKPGPDGKLSWEIALGEDGAVSVNGQKMGK